VAFDIIIDRQFRHSKSIIGKLSVNGSPLCYTLELPWKDNQQNVSCIPQGAYSGFVRTDGTRGWRIELQAVPGRGHIQIHVGNYPSDILGCILVGTGYTTNMVTNSHTARSQLKKAYQDAGSPSNISVTIQSTLPAYFAPKKAGTAIA
jgi:hypothetical protein